MADSPEHPGSPSPEDRLGADLWRRLAAAAPAKPAACPAELDLAGYLDDTLPAWTREAVEGHLAACPDCRAAIIDARAALAEHEPAPAAVIARAKRIVEPEPIVLGRIGPRASWQRVAGWGLAAAASLAVAFAGYDVGASTQTNDEDALVEMTFGLITPLEREAFDAELFALAWAGEVSENP